MKGAKASRPKSNLEETLAMQLKAAAIPFVREALMSPMRKFRFDFVLTGTDIAIECEGGAWVQGRHTRGAGFLKDLEKYNLAAENGYLVLRYTMAEIKSGAALAQIERILGQ